MSVINVVIFNNEKNELIGVMEWRERPLDERRAKKLYDLLKERGYLPVVLYNNMEAISRWDGMNDVPGNPQWYRPLVTTTRYEDAAKWLREWD
ncbi:MAG: hypothetical protein Q8Q65_03305 [bacterium]|nr:hypothetical protein [bacterium]